MTGFSCAAHPFTPCGKLSKKNIYANTANSSLPFMHDWQRSATSTVSIQRADFNPLWHTDNREGAMNRKEVERKSEEKTRKSHCATPL